VIIHEPACTIEMHPQIHVCTHVQTLARTQDQAQHTKHTDVYPSTTSHYWYTHEIQHTSLVSTIVGRHHQGVLHGSREASRQRDQRVLTDRCVRARYGGSIDGATLQDCVCVCVCMYLCVCVCVCVWMADNLTVVSTLVILSLEQQTLRGYAVV